MRQDRKTAEVISAAYVAMFAAFIFYNAAGGVNVLSWTNLNLSGAAMIATCFAAAAITHAFGIWLNGRWRWSPVVRLVGLAASSVLYSHLSTFGSDPPSTALFTYLSVCVLFLFAAITTARDLIAAGKGTYGHREA